MIGFSADVVERFMSKVDRNKSCSCWEWSASIGAGGYGQFRLLDRMEKSHRVSYRMFIGTIPEGINVCHKCDNTSCVRPTHLFLGTQKDNMVDMENKKRHPHPRGEDCGKSKLSKDTVLTIRRIYSRGDATYSELAKQFSVSRSTVAFIIQRRTWKHV